MKNFIHPMFPVSNSKSRERMEASLNIYKNSLIKKIK